jgi:hypothetical protein
MLRKLAPILVLISTPAFAIDRAYIGAWTRDDPGKCGFSGSPGQGSHQMKSAHRRSILQLCIPIAPWLIPSFHFAELDAMLYP